MQYELTDPGALGLSDLARWRDFQRKDDRLQSPFLCPEFVITLARHFDDVAVLKIKEHDEVVAFFPFQRNRFGTATALGFGLADLQAIICRADFRLTSKELLTMTGSGLIEFDHLVAHQADQLNPSQVEYEPSPVIDISAGYDEWLAEKTKKPKGRVKNALYKRRRLERELGTLHFEYDVDRLTDLETLMAWKSDQYVRTGRADRFVKYAEFVSDLVKSTGNDFSTRLSVVRVDDRPLAACLSLRAFDQLATWFPAYDANFAKLSPGLVSVLDIVRAASDDGIRMIDLGKGEADYKESFKNYDTQVASGWLRRPAIGAYLHLARRAPQYALTKFVLEHPKLRVAARNALNLYGEARLKIKN